MRAQTGKPYKDTKQTLDFFPGNVAKDAALTSRDVTLKIDRLRYISTGMYASPGVPVTVTLSSSTTTTSSSSEDRDHGHLPAAVTLQIGTHSWVDGSADHGVGWKVPWKRFPELTVSGPLGPAPGVAKNFTSYFGGLIMVDATADLLGQTLRLSVANALRAPSFQLGVTTAAEWTNGLQNAPAPYGEIETSELVFVVNASYYRQLSFVQMEAVAQFWSAATCEVMGLFRQPAGGNRSKTRIVFDVVTADAGNGHTRWGQPHADGGHTDYPATAYAAGCEFCVETGYPGDEAAIFAMDAKATQHEGQWQLFNLLGAREQLDMYHPSGFNTFLVLPNLAPVYVAQNLGLKPRDLSAWEKTAASLKARTPGPPRSHVGRYSWYEHCPQGYPAVAEERDCLTNAMMWLELADAFGWSCFQHAFDYYAGNLTRQTKVGNNDQKVRLPPAAAAAAAAAASLALSLSLLSVCVSLSLSLSLSAFARGPSPADPALTPPTSLGRPSSGRQLLVLVPQRRDAARLAALFQRQRLVGVRRDGQHARDELRAVA
eukprot:SAG22_NODE_292_length_12914_cov_41.306594_6_plen_543_part_00